MDNNVKEAVVVVRSEEEVDRQREVLKKELVAQVAAARAVLLETMLLAQMSFLSNEM